MVLRIAGIRVLRSYIGVLWLTVLRDKGEAFAKLLRDVWQWLRTACQSTPTHPTVNP